MKKDYRKEIIKLIARDLEKHGFKRKGYMGLYKEIAEDFLGTIGFGVSRYNHPSSIFLNPVIGVLSIEVERLFRELSGQDTLKIMMPTISTPLGYLLPEKGYREWQFDQHVNNDNTIEDLTGAIKIYAEKFYNRKNTLEAILEDVINNQHILKTSRRYKLPILFYCIKNKREGMKFIDKNITLGIEGYDKFRTNFLSLK